MFALNKQESEEAGDHDVMRKQQEGDSETETEQLRLSRKGVR